MTTPTDTRSAAGGRTGGESAGADERLKASGQQALDSARDEARTRLERGKDTATESVGRTADALQRTADSLAEEGQDGLAQAMSVLARNLSELADGIEHRSLDDLSREARRLARENPALFIAGGVAIGVALTRFFKASATSPAEGVYGSEAVTVPGEGRPAAGPAATGRTPGSPGTGASTYMGGSNE